MTSDQIHKLYYAAKNSGLFNNIVPIDGIRFRYYTIDMSKVYGRWKHNLPHNFYLGFFCNDINYVLVGSSSLKTPRWIVKSEEPHLIYSIDSIREAKRIKTHPNKTYLRQSKLVAMSAVVGTEEILKICPEPLTEFILFNLDLLI